MDTTLAQKIANYQSYIIEILENRAKLVPVTMEKVERQVIADTTRNHFQLVSVGWWRENFRHSTILHFDIKPDGKIWIQVNWTEDDVAEMLMEKGVLKSEIVIGFHPPYVRPHTGFAVA
jgi:XisI protein